MMKRVFLIGMTILLWVAANAMEVKTEDIFTVIEKKDYPELKNIIAKNPESLKKKQKELFKSVLKNTRKRSLICQSFPANKRYFI